MNENKETRKILPLKSDIVFKRVFSREGNEDILKALLEAILDKKIQEVVVKNPELPKNLYDSKAGILDIKVEIYKHSVVDIEMHFIELPKFERKNPEANTPLKQWLWLLSGREDKLEMAKKENKEIGKAIDIIKEMSMDEKEWELYMSRHMAIMDYNTGMLDAKDEGLKEGIEKGTKLRNLEIAKNMLKKDIDVKTIEEVTGLSKQEIEELINDKEQCK